MDAFNKYFTPTALSFAIALSLQPAYAEAPGGEQGCNPETIQALIADREEDSLEDWGIWCGVDTYLAAITEDEPTAAGGTTGARARLRSLFHRGDGEAWDPAAGLEIQGAGGGGGGGGNEPPGGGGGGGGNEPPGGGGGGGGNEPPGGGGGGEPPEDDLVGYAVTFSTDATGKDPGVGPESYESIHGMRVELETSEDGDTVTYAFYGIGDEGNPYEEDSFGNDKDLKEKTDVDGDSFDAKRNNEPGNPIRLSGDEVLQLYWAGTFNRNLNTEDDGDDEVDHLTTFFVVGVPTPLADIQDMINGAVSASYLGKSYAFKKDVSIDVNFGTESWSGSWSGGKGHNFGASGDVSGNGITSTSVTDVDSGTVNGTFYGGGAEALGGAYEVTKDSVTEGDVFSTIKQ